MNQQNSWKKTDFYDDYAERLSQLCGEYPGIPEKFTFGTSYLGREIPAVRLGTGAHRLIFIGGVGGAVFTTELLLRYLRDYADAVQSGRRICGIDVSYLFHTREITVVPLLNPDGAVLRAEGMDMKNPLMERLTVLAGAELPLWDTNGRGVDLRCNYDAQFDLCMQSGAGIGQRGYPGMHPESEPECAAVCRYLRAGGLDLGIQFLDGVPGEHGKIFWNSRGGADFRTRTIAKILSGHTGYGLDDGFRPGSVKDFHRAQSAGPFFEIACVRECEEVSQALLALRYGQLQKLLFHSAVL